MPLSGNRLRVLTDWTPNAFTSPEPTSLAVISAESVPLDVNQPTLTGQTPADVEAQAAAVGTGAAVATQREMARRRGRGRVAVDAASR